MLNFYIKLVHLSIWVITFTIYMGSNWKIADQIVNSTGWSWSALVAKANTITSSRLGVIDPFIYLNIIIFMWICLYLPKDPLLKVPFLIFVDSHGMFYSTLVYLLQQLFNHSSILHKMWIYRTLLEGCAIPTQIS